MRNSTAIDRRWARHCLKDGLMAFWASAGMDAAVWAKATKRPRSNESQRRVVDCIGSCKVLVLGDEEDVDAGHDVSRAEQRGDRTTSPRERRRTSDPHSGHVALSTSGSRAQSAPWPMRPGDSPPSSPIGFRARRERPHSQSQQRVRRCRSSMAELSCWVLSVVPTATQPSLVASRGHASGSGSASRSRPVQARCRAAQPAIGVGPSSLSAST